MAKSPKQALALAQAQSHLKAFFNMPDEQPSAPALFLIAKGAWGSVKALFESSKLGQI